MSHKGERNQVQQHGKLQKAYGGYLPSVEENRPETNEGSPRMNINKGASKTLMSAHTENETT